MKLYLDACCLSRPYDQPGQIRIIREAEAVRAILRSRIPFVGGEVLENEILRCPDRTQRVRLRRTLRGVAHFQRVTPAIIARGAELQRLGFGLMDALHLACAEVAADWFLTVDDAVLRRARRLVTFLNVQIANLADWWLSQSNR